MLSSATALERLQAISRRNAQVFQPLHRVEIKQLAACGAFDRAEPAYSRILEESFSVRTPERSDHN
jgi:hypothetical protein